MTFRRASLRKTFVTAVLVAATAATALAQRGGSYNSYSGNQRYDGKFVFVRMSYPDFSRSQARWAHDWPIGEEQFMRILTGVSNVVGHVMEHNIMDFNDPDIFKFPVIYLCEPGFWGLSDAGSVALKAYLQKGGFMIVDDFHINDWSNFEAQMSRVFPEAKWFPVDVKHPIFHSFFEIDDPYSIVNHYDRANNSHPLFRAMFEDNDPNKRMLVMANYNTDISEYWEYAAEGYQMVGTNDAYKIGVNEFIYAITH